MAHNPATFVRVSLPHGHFTVPRVVAERGGLTVLRQDALDKHGRPRRAVAREELGSAEQKATTRKNRAARKRDADKLRDGSVAATPNPIDPEDVSGDTSEE